MIFVIVTYLTLGAALAISFAHKDGGFLDYYSVSPFTLIRYICIPFVLVLHIPAALGSVVLDILECISDIDLFD